MRSLRKYVTERDEYTKDLLISGAYISGSNMYTHAVHVRTTYIIPQEYLEVVMYKCILHHPSSWAYPSYKKVYTFDGTRIRWELDEEFDVYAIYEHNKPVTVVSSLDDEPLD